ncbi:hypothetical protein [Micromonospora sp. WMMD710]|uniref:hypothetical protein n=1 Tax=Micromonospora sp. WMMD710 TaxID=3016085 RepID=UPI0024169171|nr:hypothetical protein [Micromonospora sp. WMMD710]MDG4760517.1 hypothetical protein [Micromonospora sp. WMMD710]
MPKTVDQNAGRTRCGLPFGLTGLAVLACAACCAIPLLLTAGILSDAGWAAADSWMPGIAVTLAALAGGAWWWVMRRSHRGGCVGGSGCGCSTGSPA